jgi:hypothetical protein
MGLNSNITDKGTNGDNVISDYNSGNSGITRGKIKRTTIREFVISKSKLSQCI